jgi:hypothetical protein
MSECLKKLCKRNISESTVRKSVEMAMDRLGDELEWLQGLGCRVLVN